MEPENQHVPFSRETTPLQEQLRDVKRRLRGVMNGTASASMRDKGLNYKVNFGVELPRLREMAAELPAGYELAAALWKEDIRECRLLAAMLMPPACFDAALADLWVEQMRFPEEAECTVMHLFCRLPYASEKAFLWIAREESMFRLCGWLLLTRLLMQGARLSTRDADEVLDHVSAELRGADRLPANAARKALLRYMEAGPEEERRGEQLLVRL